MSESSQGLVGTLARMNAMALASSTAAMASLALFGVTVLVMALGDGSPYHLSLFVQFIPGYEVTLSGALLGGLWAGTLSFASTAPVAFFYYRSLLSKISNSETAPSGESLQHSVARLKKREFALAVGLLLGTALFIATGVLIVTHVPGKPLGPHLKLIGHFLPGYQITWGGGALGFVYLTVFGGGVAFCIAAFYNRLVQASESLRD